MLHSESRFSCKKSFYTLISLQLVFLLTACGHDNRQKHLTAEDFSELRDPVFIIDADNVKHRLMEKCKTTPSRHITADAKVIKYYTDGGRMMWVDRMGVKEAAYSLMHHLKKSVPAMGFSEKAFHIGLIEDDIKLIENLNFDDGDNTPDKVLSRLEFNLMTAYSRYVIGQRFGFTNPNYTFNRLDSITSDINGRLTGFRLLYDLNSERPDDAFWRELTRKIENDSVAEYLAEIQPSDTLYNALKRMLPGTSGNYRRQIITNMERCRWRYDRKKTYSDRLIVVNIPAFHLWGYDGGKCMIDMKVGCGATKTKTPILHSMIERVEINPQWHIPMSIITKDIVRHIGDTAYFNRNNYYIAERKTGERISPTQVTADMLRSGAYRVSQEGGEGNSLGRIVFRFKNNVSVYLHDTNSRGFFSRNVRAISHGCVRVERPFDLGKFVLGEKTDEWTLDKIRMSMGLPPETLKGKRYIGEHGDEKHHLIAGLPVSPPMPIYILYFTLFPDSHGNIVSHPDIYGYDPIIQKSMDIFIND